MLNLDARDHGLLSLLRADTRLPVAELAKRLGVSRATVLNRMRRLERDGVILGYTVKLSDEIGHRPVRAHMCIRVDSAHEARVIASLRGNPNVSTVHHTTGRWDLMAELETDSLASFNKIVGAIRLYDGVAATETNLLLESYD